MECPKCGYVRLPQDEAPDYECPKCGIVYAKFASRLQEPKPAVIKTDARPSRPSAKSDGAGVFIRQKQIFIAIAIGFFLAGYFVGREHLKYEMRSALENAAAGIKSALSGAADKPTEQPRKPKVTKSFPVKATLLRKGVRSLDYGRSEITFAANFSNATGKEIRAFDGVLTFTDLLGNEILSAGLAVNDSLAAGGSLEWEGKLDYNQFISSHERLRNAETENTKVTFTLKKILFADGTVQDFQ